MTSLVVALDTPDYARAEQLIHRLAPLRPMFKVGYEAYYGFGEPLLEALAASDCDVLLDLKLHDIPRTIAAAVRALTRPGVRFLTIHALGGEAMMRAAVTAAAERAAEIGVAPPQFFGVTILTSLAEIELPEIGLEGGIGESVVRLAALARNAGCIGVVCSPEEAGDLKAFFGSDFATLCPGIRPLGDAVGDQRRVTTPAAAVAAGADYLVVGRPILEAADPYAAAVAILTEMRDTERV